METETIRAASVFKLLVKRLEQALVTSGPITLERFATIATNEAVKTGRDPETQLDIAITALKVLVDCRRAIIDEDGLIVAVGSMQ